MARASIAAVLAGAAGLLALFAGLALAVRGGAVPAVDGELVEVSEAFYEHGTAWRAAEATLDASIVLGAALAVAVLALLLRRGDRRAAVFWGLAVGGVLVLDQLLKALVRRPGIGASSDEWSFPSGNAMASVAIALGVAVLLRRSRWLRPALALGALAVALEGAALVALGWHYATDVVAGWCVAAAWVGLVWAALEDGMEKTPTSS